MANVYLKFWESATLLAAACKYFEEKMNKANEQPELAQEKCAIDAEKVPTLVEDAAKEARMVKEALAGRLALTEMSVQMLRLQWQGILGGWGPWRFELVMNGKLLLKMMSFEEFMLPGPNSSIQHFESYQLD